MKNQIIITGLGNGLNGKWDIEEKIYTEFVYVNKGNRYAAVPKIKLTIVRPFPKKKK